MFILFIFISISFIWVVNKCRNIAKRKELSQLEADGLPKRTKVFVEQPFLYSWQTLTMTDKKNKKYTNPQKTCCHSSCFSKP